MTLSGLDYIILAVYLGGTLALGLALGRKIQTGEEFFLAGRRLSWWAIGMSLVATDIGGTDIIGVGGAAYTHGLAVANFEWIGCIPAMIVGAFLFIPFFWRTGVYTIPEFMERRYNVRVRVALAACWLIFMACNLGILLFASAKMLHALFGWNEAACILATAAMVGVYTCAGGLAAVVYTDTIQCVVMVFGCLAVLLMGLYELGGVSGLKSSLRAVEARQAAVAAAEGRQDANAADLDSEHRGAAKGAQGIQRLSLILPVDTPTPFPWTGILFGLAMILSPAYWIGNQAIVQRSLGARSEFEAKAAYVWGALLKNLIPLIIAVPGLIALAKFPELADGDQAFPKLVAHLLPTGLRGLFLAAFIAALMSSVDSYLNAASTIVTCDFYTRLFNPAANAGLTLRVGRVATVVLMCWGVLFAFGLTRVGSGVYAIFQTLMAFFQGPALAILLTGILWKRGTGAGAFAGFVSGVACAVSLFLLSLPPVTAKLGWEPLFQIAEPFLYFSVWAFLLALTVHVTVSLCTAPEPEERIAPLLYHRRSM